MRFAVNRRRPAGLRQRHLLLGLAGFAAVILVLGEKLVWEVPLYQSLRAQHAGTIFSFADLRSGDEISVVVSGYSRPPRELRFRFIDGVKTLVVSQVEWTGPHEVKFQQLLQLRSVNQRECLALDRSIGKWSTDSPEASHFPIYLFTYLSQGTEVGRATLFGRRIIDARNYLAKIQNQEPMKREEVRREVEQEGVDWNDFQKWLTFEMLFPPEDNSS